jgi:hypothetical protein
MWALVEQVPIGTADALHITWYLVMTEPIRIRRPPPKDRESAQSKVARME